MTELLCIKNKNTDLIQKLVLIDCAAYKDKPPFFIKFTRIQPLAYLTMLVLPKKLMTGFTLKRLLYDPKKITADLITRYSLRMKEKRHAYAYSQTAKQAVPANYDSLITSYSSIKIPTLIIWGEKDKALLVRDGKRLNKSIASSKLVVIPDCGHIPHEEFPKETSGLLKDFIK